jgi:hypothetical protein
MRVRNLFIGLLLAGSVALVFAAETQLKVATNPAFDKMKTLVGKWEGMSDESGKSIPTNARFQLISDNSALIAWLNEGIADEMVTMFHLDGNDVMATHYCAAHNQPRMVLVTGGDPNKLVFKFKDGTNIGPNSGHMNQVTFVIDGPSHHAQDWVYLEKGKETIAHFDFKRKSR